jgi:hypothetical protein
LEVSKAATVGAASTATTSTSTATIIEATTATSSATSTATVIEATTSSTAATATSTASAVVITGGSVIKSDWSTSNLGASHGLIGSLCLIDGGKGNIAVALGVTGFSAVYVST